MKHPFDTLKNEYSQLLAIMKVKPEKAPEIDKAARDILAHLAQFDGVTKAIGIPLVFLGPSFYREASLNFNLSPAQGDPWRRVSTHVPRGRGPFQSWQAAALDAYHLNGLDKVGAGNWTWELVCFYFEIFNGLGYRDFHHMHSPYLWAGTNIQTIGKYTADGSFDSAHWDEQLGAVPIAKRIVELAPDLDIPTAGALAVPAPVHSGIIGSETGVDVKWLQGVINKLGWQPPLDTDGSYGTKTSGAVQHFQRAWGIAVDFAGPETVAALKAAETAIEKVVESEQK